MDIHISKIQNHLVESTKKLTKRSLIDEILKRLPDLNSHIIQIKS